MVTRSVSATPGISDLGGKVSIACTYLRNKGVQVLTTGNPSVDRDVVSRALEDKRVSKALRAHLKSELGIH